MWNKKVFEKFAPVKFSLFAAVIRRFITCVRVLVARVQTDRFESL